MILLGTGAPLMAPCCCVSQEADTDDNQGTLGFDEFCAFYKMMSTRRDLYLLMLTYSNHKDYLDADDLKRFLEIEQKVGGHWGEKCSLGAEPWYLSLRKLQCSNLPLKGDLLMVRSWLLPKVDRNPIKP